ncbi:protein LKAAEAR1-like [Symsagittifera roscoffensis]|uniref:protein LKAAEAR1-like n=1 Tax=Symsagittifera roscoffensis TaxID=84072 RepID=UPI00307B1536
MADEEEPFRAHNWKQLTPQQLRNLPAVQRGKYLAYEEPPKDVLDAQEATLKRIRETYKQKKMATKGKEPIDLEREKQEILIGQLKAAEARNRLKAMKSKYHHYRAEDVAHLITTQPTALASVKLECLLPAKEEDMNLKDPLNRLKRRRVERILDDVNSYA